MKVTQNTITSLPNKTDNLNKIGSQSKKQVATGLSVTLATIISIEKGYPLVHWPTCSNDQPIKALSQVRISSKDINKTCSLAFIDGDLSQPLVMGLLYEPNQSTYTGGPQLEDTAPFFNDEDAPLVIRSNDAITLQAGDAKIQLFADGRINIQGLRINSQAYGPNKVKGASVKIN